MKTKRHGSMLALLLIVLLLATACQGGNAPTSSQTETASGSADTTTAGTSEAETSATATTADQSGTTAGLSFTLETYPRIDGSTATIPLSEAFMSTLTGKSVRPYVVHNKTHQAYLNLLRGDADIIFVTYPSEEEFALAKEANTEFEIVPIVREGFVFLTNTNNPVESLSQAQIVDIYTGAITNWKDVGGPDLPIVAYQRPANSGSQSGFLELVMKDVVPMEPPMEQVIASMGMLVDVVAAFNHEDRNGLGYSYYYYVTDMWKNDMVKILAVDGVQPSPETIASGQYPYCTAYYAVLRADTPADHPARQLLAWILSEDGQRVAKQAGYVRLKE